MWGIANVFLPAALVRVVGVGDNDLFYFGDAWLGAHAGARQAVTGCVFLVQRMLMCRSDVDAEPQRQTVYPGERLKPDSPASLFEHKWATLNSESHMAADVTVVVSAPLKECST